MSRLTQPRPRRASALGAVLAATLLAAPAAPVFADSPSSTRLARQLVRETDVGQVNRHLIAWQRIADRNSGTRADQTSGYTESVTYVRDTLRRAGYTPRVEDFTYEIVEDVAATVVESAPVARNLVGSVMELSTNTPVGGVTGRLVATPTTQDGDATPGCEASDYAGQSFTGAIALIQRGSCTFAQKHAAAADAGAILSLVFNNNPDANVVTNGTLGEGTVVRTPVGELSRAQGELLLTDIAKGETTVTVDLRTQLATKTSQNVIAETRTGRPDNVVMLGSHLDSVPAGAGVNDNGSGSAALLAIAQNLARHPVKNKVRFAWWGAEELGLLGSTAYVAGLPFEEQLDIALYLNFDMIGSPNAVRFVYDGDDSDAEGAPAGPFGSAQIEQVFNGFFDDRGLLHRGTDFDGRSDYGPFIAAGIPSGGLFTGADGTKTEEEAAVFGGTPGIQYDPCYHQACDNLGNIDRAMLDTMSDATAWTAGRFALDTSDVNGVDAASRTRAHSRVAAASVPLAHSGDVR